MSGPMPQLIRGDARNLPLADESVDLVVTSPPYFGLRDYGTDAQIGSEPTPTEFLDALLEVTAECVRVLKPSGSLFVNLGDKYNSAASGQNLLGKKERDPAARSGTKRYPGTRGSAATNVPNKSLMLLPERYRIRAVDDLGLIARAVLVWSKPNGLPESVTDRVRRSHEDWVHLTKAPRYFAAVDEIREPVLHPGWSRPGRSRAPSKEIRSLGETSALRNADYVPNPLGKLPGSVWEIATQPLRVPAELGVDHFAAFPMEWPRKLILGWSPPYGVVLDPFSGTGTTALVATMLGRTGIGVDLSADYQRLARWRCSDPKERARAAGLDSAAIAKIPVADSSQFDLFGGAA